MDTVSRQTHCDGQRESERRLFIQNISAEAHVCQEGHPQIDRGIHCPRLRKAKGEHAKSRSGQAACRAGAARQNQLGTYRMKENLRRCHIEHNDNQCDAGSADIRSDPPKDCLYMSHILPRNYTSDVN